MRNDFEVIGDKTNIFLTYHGNKIFTTIDTEDLSKLQAIDVRWSAEFEAVTKQIRVGTRSRLIHCNNNSYSTRLHRFLMNAPSRYDIDHKNGDMLDNRKQNLRIVTRQENIQNRTRLNRNNTSGKRNVIWDKERNKWRVQFKINRKLIVIGRYDTIEEASNIATIKRLELMRGAIA